MPTGNYRHHCVSVRSRLTGSGTFHSQLLGLDESNFQDLTDITMSTATERYPNQLANFIQQRMKLVFWVDELDAQFTLGQITFYIKPIATGYPQ